MKEIYKRCSQEARNGFIKELDKILISLAYQKVDGRLTRTDINHTEIMKRIKKGI